jgi:hypothetical protein
LGQKPAISGPITLQSKLRLLEGPKLFSELPPAFSHAPERIVADWWQDVFVGYYRWIIAQDGVHYLVRSAAPDRGPWEVIGYVD